MAEFWMHFEGRGDEILTSWVWVSEREQSRLSPRFSARMPGRKELSFLQMGRVVRGSHFQGKVGSLPGN